MAFSKSRRLGDLVTNTDGDLTAAGDVGIGTSSPSEKLEVAGKIKTGGQVRAGSYLEAFPSFSFANDTDTGMFSDTDNQLEFSTGGSSRLSIDSTGKVGIGAASGGAKLHVQIDNDSGGIFADANTGLVLKNNSSTDDSAVTIAFQTNQGTGTMLQTVFPNADTNRHGELYVSTANSSGTLAERARFTHEGLKFPAGLGIDFQNTATGINSSSSTSALFDDYEEGTWSPVFTATGLSVTHDISNGYYTKIGNHVFFSMLIGTSAVSGTSGYQLTLTGLPYTALNSAISMSSGSVGLAYKFASNENGIKWFLGANTSYIRFYDGGSNTGAIAESNHLSTASASNRMYIIGHYITA